MGFYEEHLEYMEFLRKHTSMKYILARAAIGIIIITLIALFAYMLIGDM